MKILNSIPLLQPVFGKEIKPQEHHLSVVVFLPNLASPYARSIAKALNDWIRPLDNFNANLISISMTPEKIALDAIPRLLLKYPVVSDPEGRYFQHFSITPAPLLGCIPRTLPDSGLARALLEWRKAFRARGATVILKDNHVAYEERWARIDTRPNLEQVLFILGEQHNSTTM